MLPPQPWFKKCISVRSVWVFWTLQRRGTSLRRMRCARAEPASGGTGSRAARAGAGEGRFPRDDSRGCREGPSRLPAAALVQSCWEQCSLWQQGLCRTPGQAAGTPLFG